MAKEVPDLYGLCLGYVWVMFGVMFGLCMGYVWVMFGLWIICGLYVGVIWDE